MPDLTLASWILLGSFAALLVLKVPITFSLAVSSIATAMYLKIPLMVILQQMVQGVNSFSLLAIPFFIIAVIIMGGVISGVFTATESAAVAYVYAFIVTFFIYREIPLSRMNKILYSSLKTLAMVMSLIATAKAFGWLLAYLKIPAMATNALLTISDNPVVLLLLLGLGCIMDMASLILITTPILYPVVVKTLGMAPVQFGIMMTLNLCIGLCTPPVGSRAVRRVRGREDIDRRGDEGDDSVLCHHGRRTVFHNLCSADRDVRSESRHTAVREIMKCSGAAEGSSPPPAVLLHLLSASVPFEYFDKFFPERCAQIRKEAVGHVGNGTSPELAEILENERTSGKFADSIAVVQVRHRGDAVRENGRKLDEL
jgi:ABC-type multidrug transport system fused ATPase/permease subunit